MKNHKKVIASLTAVMALTMVVPSVMANSAETAAPTAQASLDSKAAADQYLKDNAGKFNLKADLSDLAYVTSITSDAGTYVRYQQTVEGAPVFTQQVTVTLDRSNNAVLVVSDYTPVSEVEVAKTKISKKDAEDFTIKHNKVKDKNNKWADTITEYGYTVVDGKAVPAYRVVFHDADSNAAWEAYVHAGNGKVLKNKNLNVRATGTGKVFNPNPISSAGTKTGFLDNNDADSTALTGQLKSVSILGLDGSGYLKGQYVTISSKINTYNATNTFNYTRNSDSFEDVMAYYHIDTLQRYIQTLGFTNINNRSIVVNNGKYTADNSYYSPSTKALTFGSGGVDDAEDAGIIAHEYGHSIQDNQVPGFGNTLEGGAMGEGFGDYLGATYEDATSGNTYGKGCIGEWDAVSYSSSNPPCLRRLDTNKVYPRDWAGEVHDDGEIWSQPLYDMANTFGRDVATKIILQSHFSLTPNSGFVDGAKAIRNADGLLYGGTHQAQIDSIFGARGIATK
ncbi:M36 family metallopeptidase [Brevibacillus dissolubilis]|uniref:M36 family metallopeptidase n=1 Tax=Brevibacillus dissolubilis TaxID=1844116 RepID=UPI0021003FEA|nr:M36 family metallopeptidase [Brevibacillus dissolubilis]